MWVGAHNMKPPIVWYQLHPSNTSRHTYTHHPTHHPTQNTTQAATASAGTKPSNVELEYATSQLRQAATQRHGKVGLQWNWGGKEIREGYCILLQLTHAKFCQVGFKRDTCPIVGCLAVGDLRCAWVFNI